MSLPDLGLSPPAGAPVALQIRSGGIDFRNPVLTASGTFGYAREFEGLTDLRAIGGVVTKGISPKPRFGNKTPRICETAAGMLKHFEAARERSPSPRSTSPTRTPRGRSRPRLMQSSVGSMFW